MATLTPEAKQLLSRTVRELRQRLLRDLHDAAEGRYRLTLPLDKARLPEEHRKKRERLEGWLDERVRTTTPKDKKAADAARARFLGEAQKEAAATLVNRLVLLRHLEALGLSKPAVVTGGFGSAGYRELREFAPSLCADETEGYAALLQLVFDELELDLPALFGDVGLTRLFPIPPATLREVVHRLDDPGLAPAWTDDTTLGWVYQYWNDPEREALDAKLNDGGKIEPHEIASKTQMFTERYMVEWLLQNSLGLTWLCMCRKHGWTPDADRVLPVLNARRAEWRKRRDAGEVALDALMPIEGELEEHWKYYVPQPIPDDAVTSAPDSIRTLKLLDPACGSGHFLVIAFDLLAAMYREEARHLGEEISNREIAESILENNLHGIDIDPRAIQIAAAAVVLKAKRLSHDARPKRVSLVAPVLRLGDLNEEDPALVRLRHELRAEAGIPEELTNKLVKSLAGVDHLGSLLKVDAAIDDAIREQERVGTLEAGQGDLLSGRFPVRQAKIDWNATRATLLERLEAFLAHHAAEEDLGLRLDGEQLAAGVRFVRMVKEGSYDLVIGNPPYQGTSRMAAAGAVTSAYPRAKTDLYAAFIERSLELSRTGGLCALVTMRGWMFIAQYGEFRRHQFSHHDLRSLCDVDRGAFECVPNEVLAAVLSVFRARTRTKAGSVALQPTHFLDRSYDRSRTDRKRSSVLCQIGRFEFSVDNLRAVDQWPCVYWWSPEFLDLYASLGKIRDTFPMKVGVQTSDDTRFTRMWWEVDRRRIALGTFGGEPKPEGGPWRPVIAGAEGRVWCEELRTVINWGLDGGEVALFGRSRFGRGAEVYFRPGVAFTTIGDVFGARLHRFPSIISSTGCSLYPDDRYALVCLLNSQRAKWVLSSLNPTIHFTNGDVERLPLFDIPRSAEVGGRIEEAFSQHEAARESSVEFRSPGRSAWRYAQAWAQRSVDEGERQAANEYSPVWDEPDPADCVSYAVGVALGRFGANGEGVMLEPPTTAVPDGVLFLSAATNRDSLANAACAPMHSAWAEHGRAVGKGTDLRQWLRTDFFKHHRTVYESRPIFFPLSSAKRNFVAWISIHRWTSSTLTTLLADHLVPERRRLEGELDDLRKARAKPENGSKAGAERRFAEVQKLLEELTQFVDLVTQCAERGPPPLTPSGPECEVDARFEMDLDDGVMVNSAALWPLLEPQWKDPKKWWKELTEAKGRKDYDWAHLAKRYFPSRVEAKCVEDPSLAVAHGCFWRLHPAKAYAWELRLQDEIRPDFTIDEVDSDAARARFLSEHAEEARAIRLKEDQRRERKARKAGEPDANLALELDDSAVEEETEEVE